MTSDQRKLIHKVKGCVLQFPNSHREGGDGGGVEVLSSTLFLITITVKKMVHLKRMFTISSGTEMS